MKKILRVLVGSYAHGLTGPDSDRDYRSVYVTPTSELLKIGAGAYKGTSTIDENIDNTAWEIGHFLSLATKSNPTILEVFLAPIVDATFETLLPDNLLYYSGTNKQSISDALRNLFSSVWSSVGVYNAFKGYSHDQRKRLFDDREEFAKRRGKYAVAHLRVLLQGIELLTTGRYFNVPVLHSYLHDGLHLHLLPQCVEYLERLGFTSTGPEDKNSESWKNFLKNIKGLTPDKMPVGLIVDAAEYLKGELTKAFEKNPDKQTDIEKVNDFLLAVRKRFW